MDFEISKKGVLKLKKYTGNGGNVIIPDGVTAIGHGAFHKCSSLTSITIPNGVTTISSSAFCGCESLTSITIPDDVTAVGGKAFSGCSSLTSITIPDGVTTIGNGAFCGCEGLTSITIPDSVTSIGDRVFTGCKGLADTSGFIIIHGVLYDYCGNGGNVVIPDGVTAIAYQAFSERCKSNNLTSVTLPDGVTAIGHGAFYKCSSLTSITIPDGVTTIGEYAFYWCSSLTSIIIPDGVTAIGYDAFRKCSSLTSISIPDSVTSIIGTTFYNLECLKEIVIPNRFAKQIKKLFASANQHFNAPEISVIHIPSIADVSARYRPACVVGFAEDNRSLEDEDGKGYAKYIKANAAKLIDSAFEHPALFYLMIREKLITAKDLEAVTDAVQKSGNAEFIAAILEYGNSAVSEEEKAEVTKKKEEREENVANFLFDTEKLHALSGKRFVVTGKLKTFANRDEFRECIQTGGATLTETLDGTVDYLVTNTPNSGTAKNKTAVKLNIPRITEDEFNQMIGRVTE